MKLILTNHVQIVLPEKTSPEIKIYQLKGEMKVWSKSTTLSPSWRHVGHYKSLFTIIDKSLKAEKRKELKEIQEGIAGCYVAIINCEIHHNYSYKGRKQITRYYEDTLTTGDAYIRGRL